MKAQWVFMLLLIASSCDNHADYFQSLDIQPDMELVGTAVQHGSYLRDSVKTNHVYALSYKLEASSPVTFSFNKSVNYSIMIDRQTIQIKGLSISDNLILFTACDLYQKCYIDTIHLTIFDNLPPIAILNYDVTEFDGSYTLTLDGSASFDKDQRFGGAISSYDYSVNGEHYTNSVSKLSYSVNKGQNYTIHFQVQDNDNAWSNEIVTYIQI